MLKSAAKLPQHLADGISVLNLTLSKSFVGDALRSLVETYFAMGGIQVQVTCVSAEELQDALLHPDKHRDLIVRVGGYSEYFVKDAMIFYYLFTELFMMVDNRAKNFLKGTGWHDSLNFTLNLIDNDFFS